MGGVGPVVVFHAAYMEPALSLCLQELRAVGVPRASLKMPSSNHSGVRALLGFGFRLSTILLCNNSQHFERLDHYIVSAGDALF